MGSEDDYRETRLKREINDFIWTNAREDTTLGQAERLAVLIFDALIKMEEDNLSQTGLG